MAAEKASGTFPIAPQPFYQGDGWRAKATGQRDLIRAMRGVDLPSPKRTLVYARLIRYLSQQR